MFDVNITTFH